MRSARAWLLDVAGGMRLAAGAPFVVEYLLDPETIELPRLPAHCRGVMLWRERIIPVIDLAPILAGVEGLSGGWSRAVVLAWQDAPGQPLQYGALSVLKAPVELFVSDSDARPLPERPEILRQFAGSCFGYDDEVIAIVDVRRLFTRPLLGTTADPGQAAIPAVGPVTVDHSTHGQAMPSGAMPFTAFVPKEEPVSVPMAGESVTAGLTDDPEPARLFADDFTPETDDPGTGQVDMPGESILSEDGAIEEVAGTDITGQPDYVADALAALSAAERKPEEPAGDGIHEQVVYADPFFIQPDMDTNAVPESPASIDDSDSDDAGSSEIVLNDALVDADDSESGARFEFPSPEAAPVEVATSVTPAVSHEVRAPATVTVREALARHMAHASGEDLAARRRQSRRLKWTRQLLTLLFAAAAGAVLMWFVRSTDPVTRTEVPHVVAPATVKPGAVRPVTRDIAPKEVGAISVPMAPARPPE